MPENPSSILLIADPGAPAAIAERLSDSLRDALAVESAEDGPCDVSVRYHAYPVDEYAEVSEVIRTIEPGHKPEDIIIYLTDLPRRQGTTPVMAEISLPDRLGVISIPAVGGLSIDRRIKKLAQAVVAEIAGRSDEKTPSVKRLKRTQVDGVVRYVAPPALSRLRLLMGMVYANRPWRLVSGLSKVMMAAFAAGAVSLAYPTIWQLSDTMGPGRLTAATLLASGALIAWLILDHEYGNARIRPVNANEPCCTTRRPSSH